LTIKLNDKIWVIILISLILRIFSVFYAIDLKKDYYWEYGEIAKNIINGNGYSLFYIEDSKLEHNYKPEIIPSKSAFMPPGYVYFLLPFLLIKNVVLRNILLYLIQIIISLVTVYLIYILTRKFFDEKIALIASFITGILPEFIYSTLSVSPTIIYHLLILSILIISLRSNPKSIDIIVCGILITLTIYFRSEFVLLGLIIVLMLLFQKKYKYSLSIFFIMIILILPWSIRNYLTFNELMPLSSNFGLNLYRGNNPHGIGSWGDDEIKEKISRLSSKNLEVELNNIYKGEVISYVKDNPIDVIKNMFLKLLYLWFYYPNDQRASNLIYLLPTLILNIFFIIGVLSSKDWNKYKLFYLFFIYSSLVAIIFFPMIRYQTMMKILMIPFCAFGIIKLSKYLRWKILRN
jgi:4-amino-4-deoxy-L-arabinose transferase-like glycosyltransferase